MESTRLLDWLLSRLDNLVDELVVVVERDNNRLSGLERSILMEIEAGSNDSANALDVALVIVHSASKRLSR
jgi:hypothetical protein